MIEMLSFSRSCIFQAFSARRLILCEERLLQLFQDTIASDATVLAYRDGVLGQGGENGTIAIDQLGLPGGLEAIISPTDCKTARDLQEFAQTARFSHKITEIAIPTDAANPADLLLKAYLQATELRGDTLQSRLRRQRNEASLLSSRVDGLALLRRVQDRVKASLGYELPELALEHAPSAETILLDQQLIQPLPLLLTDLSGVSLHFAPSSGAVVAVKLVSHDRELVDADLVLAPEGGWHNIFFAVPVEDAAYNGSLIIERLDGAPALTLAAGRAAKSVELSHLPGQSLAMRTWRGTSSSPSQASDYVHLLGRPTSIEGAVLATEHLATACGGDIGGTITLSPECFVQTHPVENAVSNFVLRDIETPDNAIIETGVCLAHQSATPTRFVMALANRSVPDTELHDWLLRSETSPPKGVHSITTKLKACEAETLSLPVNSAVRKGDARLVLAAMPEGEPPRFAWAQWRHIGIRLRGSAAPRSHHFTHMAALQNTIQFADGAIAEDAINREVGFPVITAASGDSYVQTHPVDGRVTAARFDHFVPEGTRRLWIDVANVHSQASSTEFAVLVTPQIVPATFGEFHDAAGLASLEPDRLHSVMGGAILKKAVLAPAATARLDLVFWQPLRTNHHLYLYVRTVGGPARFGWCRWFSLAMIVEPTGISVTTS